jgi:uncharacterized membrane protein YfcA
VSFAIVTDPWFWGVGILAVTLSGISKGGLGGGAGGVAAPMMAMVIPPAQGAAIMLPVLCVMDLAGINAYLGRWDRRVMRVIIPAGLLGCVVGTLSFRGLNDNWIRVLLGVIALGFLAYNLYPRSAPRRTPSDAEGWFWSTLAGFTSFVSHSGSPPLLVYMLPQKLDKAVFVSTLLVFFAAMNYAKIVPYWWLGLLDLRNLATSLVLIPVGIAGTYLGVWLQTRINALWFYRIVHALLLLTGAKLLYDGLTQL